MEAALRWQKLINLLSGFACIDDAERLILLSQFHGKFCISHVAAVAESVNWSQSHFSREFKAHTGYSPYEYIILRRIDKAKHMLTSTQMTVKQIAYHTGYNSEENFIHSFQKNVGLSPSLFRKYPI